MKNVSICTVSVILSTACQLQAAETPNIIVICADDQ